MGCDTTEIPPPVSNRMVYVPARMKTRFVKVAIALLAGSAGVPSKYVPLIPTAVTTGSGLVEVSGIVKLLSVQMLILG